MTFSKATNCRKFHDNKIIAIVENFPLQSRTLVFIGRYKLETDSREFSHAPEANEVGLHDWSLNPVSKFISMARRNRSVKTEVQQVTGTLVFH